MDNTNLPVESAPAEPQVAEPKTDWLKKIKPKYLIIVLIVAAVGVAAFYYKNLFIAATVDGHIISRISVIKKLEKQTGSNTLDTLINNQLLANEAKAKNVSVSADEVSQQLAKIKTSVESQGATFDDALKQANLTLDDLKLQVSNELLLEKLLGDKIAVSDSEVNDYITNHRDTIPADQESAMRPQIKEQLVQDKVSQYASQFLSELKMKAKIRTYVNY